MRSTNRNLFVMEEMKRLKAMRIICSVIVILWSILGMINAYDVISLPRIAVVVLNLLSICAIIGLGYVNFKELSNK